MTYYRVIYDNGRIVPDIKVFDTLDEVKEYFKGWEDMIDSVIEVKEVSQNIWPYIKGNP